MVTAMLRTEFPGMSNNTKAMRRLICSGRTPYVSVRPRLRASIFDRPSDAQADFERLLPGSGSGAEAPAGPFSAPTSFAASVQAPVSAAPLAPGAGLAPGLHGVKRHASRDAVSSEVSTQASSPTELRESVEHGCLV